MPRLLPWSDPIAVYALVCVAALAAAVWQPEPSVEADITPVTATTQAAARAGATPHDQDLVTLALAPASGTPGVALLPSRP